ncbi:glycoside hydrolase family 36 protein [Aquimarina algiphila]|uniref:glycoside hydrolase family 36 protein n=1 Tax=Aquimarina algiphila TaxID=2047982 RepID=UPI0023303BE7|nr:glycoside hydrolase family 36 protein [Aquimarina algiphila]
MANLTTKGWDFLQDIGKDQLPYNGISIYTKTTPFVFELSNQVQKLEKGLFKVTIKLQASTLKNTKPVKLVWKIPAINLKGTWLSNYESDRRIYAEFDAERMLVSRAAYEAPVISLFGHNDENLHTFACSDAIHTLSLGAGLREEDGWIYCNVILFKDPVPDFDIYELSILLDYRKQRYENSLRKVSSWWASMTEYTPMFVPDIAKLPMYSTWYSYHQDITTKSLLEECRTASLLGYKTIIVDDGWQTNDSNRGYAFTGDWLPERFPDMSNFVKEVHDLNMKIMLWYSVPFFGKHSTAFQQFKGKFLHFSEEFQAAILDPRYPEIRDYLVNTYAQALKNWDLDGFKLDFIDHFIPYKDTVLTTENGRDYAAIGPAVDRLMTDVMKALTAIKPDILIEYRQHYIGPVLRKCGNMFRAHDCPNDAVTNRRRVIDLRLLSGNTAVHSDMFMWNYEESVELAALQFLNILFSVPQISVRLNEISATHQQMVNFYTEYWIKNRDTLLDSYLTANGPSENYPLIKASSKEKQIITVHANLIIEISGEHNMIDIINAKTSEDIILQHIHDHITYDAKIFDCLGNLIGNATNTFKKGMASIKVPISGMITLSAI